MNFLYPSDTEWKVILTMNQSWLVRLSSVRMTWLRLLCSFHCSSFSLTFKKLEVSVQPDVLSANVVSFFLQLFNRRGRLLSDLHAECLGLCGVTEHRRSSPPSRQARLRKASKLCNELLERIVQVLHVMRKAPDRFYLKCRYKTKFIICLQNQQIHWTGGLSYVQSHVNV